MKKKMFIVLMAIGVVVAFASCQSNGKSKAKTGGKSVDDVLEEQTKETRVISIDTTNMNKDMVYATIFNLVNDAPSYNGQVIRIKGYYDESKDPTTGLTYHYCIVKDATACCAQGMEFLLPDGAEYPAVGTDIVVTGTYEWYKDHPGDQQIWYRLGDAEMSVINSGE